MFEKSKYLKWFEVVYVTEPPFTDIKYLVAFDEDDAIERFKKNCEDSKYSGIIVKKNVTLIY